MHPRYDIAHGVASGSLPVQNLASIPPSLRLPIFQDPCSPGPFFPRFLFPKNPKTLKNPREKAVFQISLGSLGPGTLYFTVFFSHFAVFAVFFFLKSPYQAARKPAFSDSLGPRKAFPKIPWEPKVVGEGPLLCILKNS